MKKLQEDAAKKRKQPRSCGASNNNDGNDNTAKRQKKFKKAVEKQSEKIAASAIEAEEANNDTFTARIDAAIKRHGPTSEISAAAIIKTVAVFK